MHRKFNSYLSVQPLEEIAHFVAESYLHERLGNPSYILQYHSVILTILALNKYLTV